MLGTYFSAPKTLARLRSALSGPYIDGFAESLERDSYSPLTAIRYLRAAAHFGRFLQGRGGSFAGIDASTLDEDGLKSLGYPFSGPSLWDYHD